MLSNTSKYAIRAAIYIALNSKNGEKIEIKRIAGALNMPYPFLAKILQVLAKQKLLLSTKGPNGGFSLARDPQKISLYEIVTITDGTDIFDKCLISLRSCNEENSPCPVHDKFAPVREEIKELFRKQTLASLAADIQAQEKLITL
jgi:Rrf2 family transcriptional regulator, iron-sulfur cluster assembly transcription factor